MQARRKMGCRECRRAGHFPQCPQADPLFPRPAFSFVLFVRGSPFIGARLPPDGPPQRQGSAVQDACKEDTV